jgi:hypothetical protein
MVDLAWPCLYRCSMIDGKLERLTEEFSRNASLSRHRIKQSTAPKNLDVPS